jgi:hypothetical protein
MDVSIQEVRDYTCFIIKIMPFQHNSLHPIHNLKLSTRRCYLPYIFTCQLIFAGNPTLNSE